MTVDVATMIANATARMHVMTPEEHAALLVRENRSELIHRTWTLRAQLDAYGKLPRKKWEALVSDARLRALRERYTASRGSVLVVGPAGIGKTLTGIAVARRLLREAWAAGDADAAIVDGRWHTALELARAIRETRLGSKCEAMHDAQHARILFLDELGQEIVDSRWLLELLDERCRRRLPTFTTSGLTRAELTSRYGVGAVRRLIEPVGTIVDLFGGERE